MRVRHGARKGTGSAFEFAGEAGRDGQIGAFCDIVEDPNLIIGLRIMIKSEADFRIKGLIVNAKAGDLLSLGCWGLYYVACKSIGSVFELFGKADRDGHIGSLCDIGEGPNLLVWVGLMTRIDDFRIRKVTVNGEVGDLLSLQVRTGALYDARNCYWIRF